MSFQERNDKRRVARPVRIKPISQREANSETLPYVIWTCANGRQILANRKMVPLFERPGVGKPAKRADPAEQISNICDRDYVYPAAKNPPWSDPATRRRCEAILKAWGCPR